MQPVEFKGQNVIFGKDQPEYTPLPAMVEGDGTVTTVWEFEPEELRKILDFETIPDRILVKVTMLTFGKPLQPIRLSLVDYKTEKPLEQNTDETNNTEGAQA